MSNQNSAAAAQPVAWRYVPSEVWGDWVVVQDPKTAQLARDSGIDVQPLYATPPAAPEPLTDEQIDIVWYEWFGSLGFQTPTGKDTRRAFARAIERAHGIGTREKQ